MSLGFFRTWKWTLYAFIVLLYALRAATFVDPDLGWHLAAGDYVRAHEWSAPMIDPYSYTLKEHPWIDHEWLTDGIIAKEASEGRFPLVAAAFALMALLLPFLWFLRAKEPISLLAALLASGLLVFLTGVRPQVISMLLFLVVYEGLFTFRGRARSAFLVAAPFLFFVWANLHGAFPAGLLLFALAVSPRAFALLSAWWKRERSRIDPEIMSFVASVIATLATPYHLFLWKEIVETMFSPMNAHIGEWRSPLEEATLPLILLLSLSLAMIGVSWRSLPRLSIAIATLFTLMFLQHVRMMPFYLVATIPLLFLALEGFDERLKKLSYRLSGVSPRTILAWAILVWSIGFATYFALAKETTAPYRPSFSAIEAVATLRERFTIGDIYNHYDFGGWLIRRFPEERVFTDGRSPHWTDEEGLSPFSLQREIEKGVRNHRETFARYDLHVALLSVGKTDRPLPPNEKRERFKAEHPRVYAIIARLLIPEQVVPLADRLRSDGWCAVYRDQEAVLMVDKDFPLCAAHAKISDRSVPTASTSSEPRRAPR